MVEVWNELSWVIGVLGGGRWWRIAAHPLVHLDNEIATLIASVGYSLLLLGFRTRGCPFLRPTFIFLDENRSIPDNQDKEDKNMMQFSS